MDSDKALQSFKEFTGLADDEKAHRLLSKCAWNVERAVDTFFSGRNWEAEEEEEVMWDEQPMPGTSSGRPRISHFANSPWTALSNGTRTTDQTKRRTAAAELDDSVQMLDDSDVQMVEESDKTKVGGRAARNGAITSADFSEGVRAPIAPVQGVLIDQSFRETYQNRDRLWNPVFEQYRNGHQQPSSSSSSAATVTWVSHKTNAKNTDGGTNSIAMVDSRPSLSVRAPPSSAAVPLSETVGNGRSAAHSQHRKVLQTLFRPPVELMFQGDWDQALQAARQKGVWLLVNVQEASEFACAVLNRDIWSSETVREVIRSNFLFWQVYNDSTDGARIRGYYGLSSFPAIFIVDPRTGEEVSAHLKAPSDSVSFLDSLTSFLEQNPTFEARDRFVREQTSSNRLECPRASSSALSRNITTPTKKRKKPADDDGGFGSLENGRSTETTALREAAEEEEMNRQAKKIKRLVTITDGGDISHWHPFSSSATAAAPRPLPSKEELDPNEWRHWVLSGAGQSKNKLSSIDGKARIAQMLLRLPDGRSERVRMWMAAPLSALFSLISSMGVDPAKHQLVLDYPRREFSLSPQNRRLSLESVGFGEQEVVHIDRIES